MNKQETIMTLGLMKTAYPAFYKDIKPKEAEEAVKLWSMMFAGDNPNVVIEAVKSLICTLKFPPTIADVKTKMYEITTPPSMTEMEAWNKVFQAIQDSNYRAVECFEVLPPVIQKVIGSPNQLREWAMMDIETVNSVIQSNFMRSYKVVQQREQSRAMLPESTKQMIEALAEKMALPEYTGEG